MTAMSDDASHARCAPTSLAFDVGFFEGTDTALMLSHAYRVVALEANPTLVAAGNHRFRGAVSNGQLTIVNGMLDAHMVEASAAQPRSAANVTLYVNRHSAAWTSVYASTGCKDAKQAYPGSPRPENCDVVSYRPMRCAELFAQYGHPFLLKLDVEGAEWPCVRALQPMRAACRPRYIIIEENPELDLGLLVRLGYDSFKWIRQMDHAQVWGWSSGPFGEFGRDCQTGYRWRSASDAAALVVALYEHKPRYRQTVQSARRAERLAASGGSSAATTRSSSPWLSATKASEAREACGGWADLHARHSSVRAIHGNLY